MRSLPSHWVPASLMSRKTGAAALRMTRIIVNCRTLSDLYEVAARATINERCATAYLHDVRGSMQAIFSALELLGRSARKSATDIDRVEKVCALARRAITLHEKSTLEVFQLLTLQDADCTAVDVGGVMKEVVHFLRNEAAKKELTITLCGAASLPIAAERARLQTLLVGLLAAAIDAVPRGTELPVSVGSEENFAVISLGSNAGYDTSGVTDDLWNIPTQHLLPHELTLPFARQFLSNHGGRLEIDAAVPPHGSLRLYYPLMTE
jgi:signal transduction histidine kinase